MINNYNSSHLLLPSIIHFYPYLFPTQIFVVVPYVRDVNPTSERLQDIVPGLRVIEAHGQHDDLEERIDSFSAGNHTVML